MPKNSVKILKSNNFFILCFFVVFVFFSINSSIAEMPKNFEIIGNKSINKETILNYLKKNNNNFDLNDLNQFKKDLYQTNYFSKVDVEILNNKIIVTVIENPLIDYFFIEGVKNKDLKKKINKLVSLQSNNFFSEAFVKKDTTVISTFLSNLGYFNNEVKYVVKKNNDNRVNIFYNIILNNKFKIGNIFFIGDKKFSHSTLSNVVSSSRRSWLSFLSSSVPSKERVTYDKSLLKNFYSERGFFDVQISDASIEFGNNDFANITFVINAGKKFKIDKINFTDSSFSSLSKNQVVELKKIIFEIENEIYSPKIIKNVNEDINQYIDVNNISVDANIDLLKSSNSTLSLVVTLVNDTNKEIINQINVVGNDITEEKVIRNNILFTEGDRSTNYFYKKSVDNLKSLGIFKDAKLTRENINNSSNINVNIEVVEKATGEISAGAGFGSAGALISGSLKEKNYLGKGISTDVSLRLGTDRSIGSFNVTNPDFADSGISLSNSFFITESSYDNSGYESKSFGANSSVENTIFKNVNLETGLGISFDSIDAQTKSSDLIKTQDGDYLTTNLFYNILNDQRATQFETKSGYTFGFGQDLGFFFTDKPFLSNKFFGTFYHELHENFVGTIRYKINSINSLNNKDVKLSDRLFLSENDLRGFKYRGFGPIHSDDYIGGNYLYSTSFATTFPNPAPDKWGVKSNLFLDTGNLWGADLDSSADRSKLRSSIGAGLTWTSPLGPLSITYAEPISKASSDKIEKFNFKIGTVF